jgi:hypothetical protein
MIRVHPLSKLFKNEQWIKYGLKPGTRKYFLAGDGEIQFRGQVNITVDEYY